MGDEELTSPFCSHTYSRPINPEFAGNSYAAAHRRQKKETEWGDSEYEVGQQRRSPQPGSLSSARQRGGRHSDAQYQQL